MVVMLFEVDGVVNNDVASPTSFQILDFSTSNLDFAADFLTPSRVESIGKFWSDEADTALDR